ncbi:SDR family oxidoreductase [Pseudomonas sp. MYb185]|uniref:SDR family oxidoreductase n=1 Tax=Pseudomonas sp. MYb185 TaxID=1848729 RepID=UPI000CFC1BEE|nr:SDR family oxidoreductase [Pseudomonas sp. MYb185]PRB84132.1 short-chain dehydrogenase [Pseudomonas sp. MYb185]
MKRLIDKIALITGAASGLGAADARLLAEHGARVVITDINHIQGEALAAEIPGALFLVHDVADEAQWISVLDQVKQRFGRLDILVNNAGFVNFSTVEEQSLEQFRRHLQVMTEGTFLGCKHAIPLMREKGGAIINISSVAAVKGIAEVFAYTAAKGAIASMGRSIAIHCQNQGYRIRCNTILPGAHDTPMTAKALIELAGADTDALTQLQEVGQGKPEDVANLVLFLASDESRQINGAQLVIDNGETIK